MSALVQCERLADIQRFWKGEGQVLHQNTCSIESNIPLHRKCSRKLALILDKESKLS